MPQAGGDYDGEHSEKANHECLKLVSTDCEHSEKANRECLKLAGVKSVPVHSARERAP